MGTNFISPRKEAERSNEENEKEVVEFYMAASTLETVDRAFFEFLDETLDPFISTGTDFKKVPVIWTSAERAFQIKSDKDIRDKDGRIKMPVITIERTSITKDSSQHGKLVATLAPLETMNGGSWVVARRIQHEKTALFAASNSARKTSEKALNGATSTPITTGNGQKWFPGENKTIVYETLSVPMPVYVNMNYTIILKAQYQQHINEMLMPFLTKTGNWNIFELERDGHVYEAFLPKEFGANNNVSDLGEDERMYETKFDVRVLAYLIGQDANQEGPEIGITENIVKVRLPREQVIFEDPHPRAHKGQFYKE